MIRIAIVEDEEKEIALLEDSLKRYFSKNGGEYSHGVFRNGLEFIDSYKADFDVILMDIEMPLLDGFKAAQKLREMDAAVSIIFVTNMAGYAIKGYEVNAVGFIVKPVTYFALEMNLNKAIARFSRNNAVNIVVTTRTSVNLISAESLVYVEVMRHNIIYHTETDAISTRGNMKEVEERLKGLPFERCNNCFLVNLKFVKAVENNVVYLTTDSLPISRGRKKHFIEALMQYVSRNGGNILC